MTLSINEAAAYLGVGRTTIYRLIGDGNLEYIKVGSRTLISRNVLDGFLAARSERKAKDVNDD